MRTVMFLLVIALLQGCAMSSANYEKALTPLVGTATPEYFVEKFGLPAQREIVADKEYWVYKSSEGTYHSPGVAYHFEVYDQLALIFVENKLASWKKIRCVGEDCS